MLSESFVAGLVDFMVRYGFRLSEAARLRRVGWCRCALGDAIAHVTQVDDASMILGGRGRGLGPLLRSRGAHAKLP